MKNVEKGAGNQLRKNYLETYLQSESTVRSSDPKIQGDDVGVVGFTAIQVGWKFVVKHISTRSSELGNVSIELASAKSRQSKR